MELALKHVESMQADMGGTNILAPLSNAIKILTPIEKQGRIFLLTDGQVEDRAACI